MKRELFVDTVGDINLHAGMVRLDLVAIRDGSLESADSLETLERVVMPLSALLKALPRLAAMGNRLKTQRRL